MIEDTHILILFYIPTRFFKNIFCLIISQWKKPFPSFSYRMVITNNFNYLPSNKLYDEAVSKKKIRYNFTL
ncbi:MAG: hypothetical protein C5B59_06120 [Bacteroidetes bacterium]|nr:MAG: hypothetical protein C5B59_06120 [Bacteroidota bacterium]